MRLERWYVWLGVAALVTGVLVLITAVETGIARTQEASVRIQASAERQQWLFEYLGLITDAEAAQRGYLLTGADDYLQPYRAAAPLIDQQLDRLRNSYAGSAQSGVDRVSELRLLTGQKFGEMASTISLYQNAGFAEARQLVSTDVGFAVTEKIRRIVETMLAQERAYGRQAAAEWGEERSNIRAVNMLASVVNIILLLVGGTVLIRELKARSARTGALEAEISARTAELSDLSSHLQQVAEMERSKLARELHDEMGSLLISVKMDLARLQKSLPAADREIKERIERMDAALAEGVALKRRVIEELRPTLLDTMGLAAALRWQFQTSCDRAGLGHTELVPEEEINLSPDVSIAVFRIVQEATTNIIKHAEATAAELHVAVEGDDLVVIVRDNGRGIRIETGDDTGVGRRIGHGLTGIRHRVRGLGGSVTIRSLQNPGDTSAPAATKGAGTELQVRLPLNG